uniref:Nucleotide-diphospho-sugar transferase domain-containing protein n=1 Tax=Populus trichocarpa TaxID=3694 RepID=A0A3N7FGV3_POPTR
MRFLDTAFFGGLCEPSKDLNLVCTMHANCCFGLDSKLHDLGIMLQDWKTFLSLPPTLKRSLSVSWRVPQNCSLNSVHQHDSPEKSVQQTVGH